MKEEMRFYVTLPEILGMVGTSCLVFARMPWEGLSIIDKVTTFISIATLGVVAVASVELICETAQAIWEMHKARKARKGRG